jgi:hypothetical protein
MTEADQVLRVVLADRLDLGAMEAGLVERLANHVHRLGLGDGDAHERAAREVDGEPRPVVHDEPQGGGQHASAREHVGVAPPLHERDVGVVKNLEHEFLPASPVLPAARQMLKRLSVRLCWIRS